MFSSRTALGRWVLASAFTCALATQGIAWSQDHQPSKRAAKPAATATKKAAVPAAKATALALPAVKVAAPAAKASAPATTPATALIDGQAENRLLAIYQLISEGQQRHALEEADRLVNDHPNFQLAQLVLGDLLAARARPLRKVGAVPGSQVADLAGTVDTLSVLREESRQRLHAQHIRPPADTIPAQFLALSPRQRHAVAVDASRSRLYLFENSAKGMRLVADYYASVGKLGTDKSLEGDQRTPLGVYFITSRLDAATLRDFYGAGALPLNYPNPLDQSRGKTGGGIWLHGTPPDQFARAPLATDGCVAIANPDLERLLRTVERSTPVVIAKQLLWVTPRSVQAERQQFDAVLKAWGNAKSQGDVASLQRFYAPDFKNASDQPLEQWLATLTPPPEQRGRGIQIKDTSYLRWTDTSDTMVVTFGEVAEGARTGTTRRQYWSRRGTQWQIFYEGVTG